MVRIGIRKGKEYEVISFDIKDNFYGIGKILLDRFNTEEKATGILKTFTFDYCKPIPSKSWIEKFIDKNISIVANDDENSTILIKKDKNKSIFIESISSENMGKGNIKINYFYYVDMGKWFVSIEDRYGTFLPIELTYKNIESINNSNNNQSSEMKHASISGIENKEDLLKALEIISK